MKKNIMLNDIHGSPKPIEELKLDPNCWYHIFIISRNKKWYEKIPLFGKLFKKPLIDVMMSKDDPPDLPYGYTMYKRWQSIKTEDSK